MPHEAAVLGSPASFVGFGPLKENSAATDLPASWNSSKFADDLANILVHEQHEEKRLGQLKQRTNILTWHQFATQLSELFVRIANMSVISTASIGAGSTAESAVLAQVLSSKSWKVTAPLRRISRSN